MQNLRLPPRLIVWCRWRRFARWYDARQHVRRQWWRWRRRWRWLLRRQRRRLWRRVFCRQRRWRRFFRRQLTQKTGQGCGAKRSEYSRKLKMTADLNHDEPHTRRRRTGIGITATATSALVVLCYANVIQRVKYAYPCLVFLRQVLQENFRKRMTKKVI